LQTVVWGRPCQQGSAPVTAYSTAACACLALCGTPQRCSAQVSRLLLHIA
jgi:hypothetical protein